jgi:hypothetical protein
VAVVGAADDSNCRGLGGCSRRQFHAAPLAGAPQRAAEQLRRWAPRRAAPRGQPHGGGVVGAAMRGGGRAGGGGGGTCLALAVALGGLGLEGHVPALALGRPGLGLGGRLQQGTEHSACACQRVSLVACGAAGSSRQRRQVCCFPAASPTGRCGLGGRGGGAGLLAATRRLRSAAAICCSARTLLASSFICRPGGGGGGRGRGGGGGVLRQHGPTGGSGQPGGSGQRSAACQAGHAKQGARACARAGLTPTLSASILDAARASAPERRCCWGTGGGGALTPGSLMRKLGKLSRPPAEGCARARGGAVSRACGRAGAPRHTLAVGRRLGGRRALGGWRGLGRRAGGGGAGAPRWTVAAGVKAPHPRAPRRAAAAGGAAADAGAGRAAGSPGVAWRGARGGGP